MSKIAVCTGITGQFSSFMVEKLLKEGFEVHGLKRRTSTLNTERINHLYLDPREHPETKFKIQYGDLCDGSSINNFIGDLRPDICINLAAMSHVRVSFDMAEYTMDVNALGPVRILEAIRKLSPKTRYLNLCSSEIFGNSPPPQSEKSVFAPRSPYAVSKLSSYYSTINYRESYGLFSANAIPFNTESIQRGETFVTRKITKGLARCKLGLQGKLFLGNIKAARSWNSVHNTIDGLYKIITADRPDEFVIGDSQMHTVEEFLDIVGEKLNIDWHDYVEIDPTLFRPAEVDALCPDSSKIKRELGWEPKISFDQLVAEMVSYDLKLAQQELLQKQL